LGEVTWRRHEREIERARERKSKEVLGTSSIVAGRSLTVSPSVEAPPVPSKEKWKQLRPVEAQCDPPPDVVDIIRQAGAQ
jgi:hypothetical protein